jgi:hypothetical protein
MPDRISVSPTRGYPPLHADTTTKAKPLVCHLPFSVSGGRLDGQDADAAAGALQDHLGLLPHPRRGARGRPREELGAFVMMMMVTMMMTVEGGGGGGDDGGVGLILMILVVVVVAVVVTVVWGC